MCPISAAAPSTPPTPQASEASHRITLITGDVVDYTEHSDGRRVAQVHAAPREGEQPIFHTMTTPQGLFVYPSDAIGAVTSGTVERTLFNVTELARTGRKDVAVVAFDDVALADALEPALTVVAQNPEEIGRTAATTALARLDGDRTRARTITVPTRLIVRGSGERPAPALQEA